jgi:hypothetical protein
MPTENDLASPAPQILPRDGADSPGRVPSPRPSSASNGSTVSDTSSSRLAQSEPELRFPTPQGSLHLAQWLSTGNIQTTMVQRPAQHSPTMADSFEIVSWERDPMDMTDIDTVASGSDFGQLDSPQEDSDCGRIYTPDYTPESTPEDTRRPRLEKGSSPADIAARNNLLAATVAAHEHVKESATPEVLEKSAKLEDPLAEAVSDSAETTEDDGHIVTASDIKDAEGGQDEAGQVVADGVPKDVSVEANDDDLAIIDVDEDVMTQDLEGANGGDRAADAPATIEAPPQPRPRAPSIDSTDSLEYTERSLQLPSKASADDEDACCGAPKVTEFSHAIMAICASVLISMLCYCALTLTSFGQHLKAASLALPTVTQTVTVSQAMPVATPPVCPLGFMTDVHNLSNPTFAQVTPQKAVLINVPGAPAFKHTKVTVSRGGKEMRSWASQAENGLLVQLEPSDAYGTVTINVQNKRDNLNETFDVVLGYCSMSQLVESSLHAVHDAAEKAASGARSAAESAESGVLYVSAVLSSKLAEMQTHDVVDAARDAGASLSASISMGVAAAADRLAAGQTRVQELLAAEHMNDVMDVALDAGAAFGASISSGFSAAVDGLVAGHGRVQELLASERVQGILATSEAARGEMELGLLRAQIASRLFYYKAVGMQERYDSYLAKSHEYFKEQQKLKEAKKAAAKTEDDGARGRRGWLMG